MTDEMPFMEMSIFRIKEDFLHEREWTRRELPPFWKQGRRTIILVESKEEGRAIILVFRPRDPKLIKMASMQAPI